MVREEGEQAARCRRYARWVLPVAWGLLAFFGVAMGATVYSYIVLDVPFRVDVAVVSVVFFSAPFMGAFWIYEMLRRAAATHSSRALRTYNKLLHAKIESLEVRQCPDQGCRHCKDIIIRRNTDALMAAYDEKIKANEG